MAVESWLRVIGLGPGPREWLTPEARESLEHAEQVLGYRTYLERLPWLAGKILHASDNGDELTRARHGLELALSGARVAIVSGGDAGVFGMAAAVFEAIERGPSAWRELDVKVLPGVTAMLAAAAQLGAPLGNDFCAISISDNLKPWQLIERRLAHAAEADLVIALYNPASRTRVTQIARAFEVLRRHRAPDTIVAFASAVGRPGEALHVTTLGRAEPDRADMRTLVLIGASTTRLLERPGARPWIYTPRGEAKP